MNVRLKVDQTDEVNMVMKVLFVCTGNLERSPTAEAMFKGRDDLEVKSAGTGSMAFNPVSRELINWADRIFVMESKHREYIIKMSSESENKIVVLDIPCRYGWNSPILKEILRKKLSKYRLTQNL